MNRKEIPLNVRVTKAYIWRLFAVGRQFDINKGGHYDASGTCINIWCSPDDKPSCWDINIDQGMLNFPREIVGTLRLEWIDDFNSLLFLEANPHNLERKTPKHFKRPTPADLDSCLEWLNKKVAELFRLTDLHPDIIGTKCPLCAYVHPNGCLLNDLIDHIQQMHNLTVTSIMLGDPTRLETNIGDFTLEVAEKF